MFFQSSDMLFCVLVLVMLARTAFDANKECKIDIIDTKCSVKLNSTHSEVSINVFSSSEYC